MYQEIVVKSVLNKKKKRDSWFLDDYTLNPYEGCAFNCQYCYIRGSKYGLNMEERLSIKINVLEVLAKQLALRAKKEQFGMIALASATDPYMRVEETLELTRGCLRLIHQFNFPVLIITKSPLVLRDISILRDIDNSAVHAADLKSSLTRGAIVSFSFSTVDQQLADKLEPGAPSISSRLDALKRVKDSGLFAGANLMPVFPFINDSTEALEHMIAAFSDAGADYVITGGLTLFGSAPADSRTLYMQFVQRNFPHLVTAYQKLYGEYFMPPPSYQNALSARASAIIARYGMKEKLVS